MHRIASQTALATILGISLGLPAAAQTPEHDCPSAVFETDLDRDGVISADEAEAAAAREFARFDVNEDKTITREEFIGCFAAAAADTTGDQAGDAAETSGERTERSFAEADLDRDGRIDRAEFGLGAQQAFDEALGAAEGQEPTEADEGQVVTEQDVPGPTMAEEVLTDEAEAVEAAPGTEAEAGGTAAEAGDQADAMAAADRTGPGDPSAWTPQIARERFLQSPYADFPTMEDRELTAEEIAFNSAQLFSALDADRNQVLEPAEWMRIAPLAERGPAELGRVFESIDVDDDALVTLPEYAGAVVASHAAAAEAAGRQETAAAAQAADEQAGQAAEKPAAEERGAPVFLYRIYRF